MKNLSKIIENIGKILLPAILILELFIFRFLKKKKKNNISPNKKKNIIIIGGNFLNKGSQAMIFTVVDNIKKCFFDRKIYLFSFLDYEKIESEKYNFEIIPWNHELRIKLSGSFHQYLVFYYKKFRNLENLIKNIFMDTEIIIDISGYSFSSQMGQGWLTYILDIIIAKRYSISYYIFPQSIGPFEFSLKHRIFFYPLAKAYLKYPKKIYVRENDGLRYIRQFTKFNVKKSYDIVLQHNKYDLNHIFNRKINLKEFKIQSNSVGIIPNRRVFERIDSVKIYEIYRLIIKKLLENGKTIYILRHSFEDLNICKNIKNFFKNNKRVKLIEDDLNVFEIENIINKFDFIVASRYHSIIHSYRCGIPVIAIGWAVKYNELLELFDQSIYNFNIKNQLENYDFIKKLDLMLSNYNHEKNIITIKLNEILAKKVSLNNMLN